LVIEVVGAGGWTGARLVLPLLQQLLLLLLLLLPLLQPLLDAPL